MPFPTLSPPLKHPSCPPSPSQVGRSVKAGGVSLGACRAQTPAVACAGPCPAQPERARRPSAGSSVLQARRQPHRASPAFLAVCTRIRFGSAPALPALLCHLAPSPAAFSCPHVSWPHTALPARGPDGRRESGGREKVRAWLSFLSCSGCISSVVPVARGQPPSDDPVFRGLLLSPLVLLAQGE